MEERRLVTTKRRPYRAVSPLVERSDGRRSVVYRPGGPAGVRILARRQGVTITWPADAPIENEEDLAAVMEALARATFQWKQLAAADGQESDQVFEEPPEGPDPLVLLYDPGHAQPVPLLAPSVARDTIGSVLTAHYEQAEEDRTGDQPGAAGSGST